MLRQRRIYRPDDDTSPNFLGYELTPTEFMETDFTQSDDELDKDEDETQTIQMGRYLTMSIKTITPPMTALNERSGRSHFAGLRR